MSSTSVGSRPSAREARVEVVDLVGREREAELAFARSSAARPCAAAESSRAAAARRARTARARLARIVEHRLGHAVVDERQQRGAIVARQAIAVRRRERVETPRSMRATAPRPQLRAMSVAFDDHGEIVPSRGTTSSVRCASGVAARRAGRRSAAARASRARRVERTRDLDEMPVMRASADRMVRRAAVSAASSLAIRKGDSAEHPRSASTSGTRDYNVCPARRRRRG